MSTVVAGRGVVHYETQGRGQSVILLHGLLESWDHWLGTMEVLSGSCRTYALDFGGFRESNKQGMSFTVWNYVEMVAKFTERLGIDHVVLIGHSMGGTVALCLAQEYAQRIDRVAVVGSPVAGDGLALLLRLAAWKPLAVLAYQMPGALPLGVKLFSPLLARDWRTWYGMFERDLSRTTLESFHYSIASLQRTDLRAGLGGIEAPILGIYGQVDRIVDRRQGELLAEGAPKATLCRFQQSGRFPMLDDKERFHRTLQGFLDLEPGSVPCD